jgi:NodT family efflux transporter outer membrane factor (OMF) lipoprotein
MIFSRAKIPAWPVALTLLAACSVGPDYQRPQVETPQSFKELGDWKPAEPAAPASGQPWWSVYGDPVLDRLEKQVDISNQTLKASEAAYRQAVAEVGAARAGYFPSVGIDPSATRSRTPGSNGGSANTRNAFSLPVDASWVIDIWGQVRRQVESARAAAQESAADLAALRLSEQATLAQDYFQLRIADENKRLLDDTATAYARTLQITQNRYAVGVAARSDVAQAQAQLDNARSQALAVQVPRAQLEHAIAVLIGQPPEGFDLPPSPAPYVFHVPVAPAGLPSALLERNPTVAANERAVAAANANVGVALTGYFPTLTLTGSYGFSSSMLDTLMKSSNLAWTIGPQVNFNVFNGGLTTSQVAAACAGYDQTVANYRQAVLTSFQGVEDNLAALKILEQQSAAQDSAVASAQLAQNLIMNEYLAGTVDFTTVVTAEAATLSGRQSAYGIVQSRLNASVLLIENLGGGWDQSQLPDAALPLLLPPSEVPDQPGANPNPGAGPGAGPHPGTGSPWSQ